MRRLSPSLLVLASILAACHTTGVVNRPTPASFSVHIVCAGTGPSDCVPAGTTFDAGMDTDGGVAPDFGTPGLCPSFANSAGAALDGGPNLGTPLIPVSNTQTYYVAQVQALDNNGNLYTPYAANAEVYVQFEGSVTGAAATPRATGGAPLTTVPMTGGQGCVSLTIPPAYNQTAIWVEDPHTFGAAPSPPGTPPGARQVTSGSFALGASEPIYRPSPLIPQVVYTTDPVAQLTPLNNKHVIVNNGTNGAPIVVTSVTPTYFTVTDLGTASNGYQWGSMEVYTYSEPYGVQVGSTVTALNGQLSNYLGLPELNFPIWTVVNYSPTSAAPQPTEHLITFSDINDVPNALTKLSPYKSGPVEVETGDASGSLWTICALRPGSSLTASYIKYFEWVIAPPTADCTDWTSSVDVVSNQAIPDFDPSQPANWGKYICSLKGILTVIIPTVPPAAIVNLWTITPRSPSDLGPVVASPSDCPTPGAHHPR